MESHYLQKKLIPEESHKTKRDSKEAGKGETPLLPQKGFSAPRKRAIRRAVSRRHLPEVTKLREELRKNAVGKEGLRATLLHLCKGRAEADCM